MVKTDREYTSPNNDIKRSNKLEIKQIGGSTEFTSEVKLKKIIHKNEQMDRHLKKISHKQKNSKLNINLIFDEEKQQINLLSDDEDMTKFRQNFKLIERDFPKHHHSRVITDFDDDLISKTKKIFQKSIHQTSKHSNFESSLSTNINISQKELNRMKEHNTNPNKNYKGSHNLRNSESEFKREFYPGKYISLHQENESLPSNFDALPTHFNYAQSNKIRNLINYDAKPNQITAFSNNSTVINNYKSYATNKNVRVFSSDKHKVLPVSKFETKNYKNYQKNEENFVHKSNKKFYNDNIY
jgi:hypothetical protein